MIKLGMVVGTPGALAELENEGIAPQQILVRHMAGNWGDVSADDREANDRAVKMGDRILSAFILPFGVKVWVVTEWDRSATTVLLPVEY